MGLGSFCYKKDSDYKTIQPKSLRVTGLQKGFIQFFEICQSIKSEEQIEQVSYIFPTDNNMCIYSMTFQVGDETIPAELKAEKDAKEIFDEAKKVGRTAAMTVKVSPGISEVRIGNVPKDTTVSVIFKCVLISTLQNQTTILTKIPLQASEPDGSLTDLYSIPSLEIDVDFDISQSQEISDVYTNCESSYKSIDQFSGKLTINSAVITDENILIMIEMKSPVKGQITKARETAAVTVIPEFEAKKSNKKEFVFLVDCSASMLGESMRKAKESLHLFLAKLPSESFFNIICFGTTYRKLFEYSEPSDQIHIQKATTFVNEIRANLGGTEMLQLFEELFKSDVKATGGQRQIFIITDGEVYDRQKVLQKVEENSGFNRIFAIGLGHGADAGFLDEIATITNGKSDFVFNKDELTLKVAEDIELSLNDAAIGTEIHVENNDEVEVVPFPLPPLLPGVDRHVIVSGISHEFGYAMVAAKLGDTEVECVISNMMEIEVDEGKKSPLFALFAQGQLKRIEEDPANEEKCVKLSLDSGVMSKYTSYVAVSNEKYVVEEKAEEACEMDCCVDECEEPICESISFRRTRKKRSLSSSKKSRRKRTKEFDSFECELTSPSCPPPPSYSSASPSYSSACPPNSRPIPECCQKDAEKVEEEEVEKKGWESNAKEIDIVRMQSRDGFWNLSSSFIEEKFGGKSPEIEINTIESPILRKRIIATVFTLAYLKKFYSENLNKWRFSNEKGVRWLRKIESSVNWEQIINGLLDNISK